MDDAPGANDAAARLKATFELFDLAIKMLRARMIREDPTLAASPSVMQARIDAWVQARRGALDGDGEGTRR